MDKIVSLFNELKYTMEFQTPKEQQRQPKSPTEEVLEKLRKMLPEFRKVKYSTLFEMTVK